MNFGTGLWPDAGDDRAMLEVSERDVGAKPGDGADLKVRVFLLDRQDATPLPYSGNAYWNVRRRFYDRHVSENRAPPATTIAREVDPSARAASEIIRKTNADATAAAVRAISEAVSRMNADATAAAARTISETVSKMNANATTTAARVISEAVSRNSLDAGAGAAAVRAISEAAMIQPVDLERVREAARAMGAIGISEQQRSVLREALAKSNAKGIAAGVGREGARAGAALAEMRRSLILAPSIREAMAGLDLRLDAKVVEALPQVVGAEARMSMQLQATVREAAVLAESGRVAEAVDGVTDQTIRELTTDEAREASAKLLDYVAIFLLFSAIATDNLELGLAGSFLEAVAVLMRIYWLLAPKQSN
jgi:hypothetical protein